MRLKQIISQKQLLIIMKYGYLIYIAREKNKFDILVKIWYTISEEKNNVRRICK